MLITKLLQIVIELFLFHLPFKLIVFNLILGISDDIETISVYFIINRQKLCNFNL